jgi:hypothetical protein
VRDRFFVEEHSGSRAIVKQSSSLIMPFWQKQWKAYISVQAIGSEKKLQTQFVLFAGLLLSSSAAFDYHC